MDSIYTFFSQALQILLAVYLKCRRTKDSDSQKISRQKTSQHDSLITIHNSNCHQPVKQQSNTLQVFNCLKLVPTEALVQPVLPLSVLQVIAANQLSPQAIKNITQIQSIA